MTVPRLSSRLLLEELVASPDGAGGETEAWVAVATHHVALIAQGAAEGENGRRRYGATSYKATLRYAPHGDVNRPRPDQRLRDGARIFNILGVADADDRRQWLACWLEEGGPS